MTQAGTDIESGKGQGRIVALILLSLAFLITVISAALSAAICSPTRWADVKQMLDLLVPAETALLGVAVAFYMTD